MDMIGGGLIFSLWQSKTRIQVLMMKSQLLKSCFAQILWTLLKWLEGSLMQKSGMSNCWMLRPDRSYLSLSKCLVDWSESDDCLSPGVYWHGRRRKDWPNGWTDEVESSTQARLARPLSRTTQRSIFLTSLNLNSLAMFRRRIRTFWTGEESWLSCKRRLEQWWLLMRRTWSSGDSCGEWLSAVMLSSRLLTHVILCSLGWWNWVLTFDSSTFLLLL